MNSSTAHTVFCTQKPARLDLTGTRRYGALHFLVPPKAQVGKADVTSESVLEELKIPLAMFNPETDFLLLLGDPVIMALTLHVVLTEHGHCTVLKWDKNASLYYTVHVEQPRKDA